MALVHASEQQQTLARSWLPAPYQQELAYRVAGSGQPVVLLHGLWNSSRIWQGTLETFSPAYHLYAPDLPGHGQSPACFPWRLREVAALLGAWMRSLEIGPATVVGHSMGGALAMLLAATNPELIQRLVLVNAVGLPLQRPFLRTLARAGMSFVNQQTARYTIRYGGRSTLVPPLATWQALDEIMTCDLRPDLSAITCPTLIIWGMRDPLLPTQVGAMLQSWIQGAELVLLPNVRHQPQRQVPATFHDILGHFLERWDSATQNADLEARMQ